MDERGPALGPADVEAIVRAYLGRMARRYSPLLGALLVLILLATLMPSRSQPVNNVAGSETTSSSNDTTGSAGIGATSGNVAAPSSRGGTRSSGSLSSSGGPITPPAAAGSRGVARSGVACGPGVRQVQWTVYAPPCVPRYTGYNGGNRYRGVTKDKIVAFYRRDRSAQDTAINAALGSANLDDNKYISDLQTYMSFFNKQFELYGRRVELTVYDGQGDYLNEDQGLDQGQAQADAQTAVDLHGFVDSTFPLKGSYPYWQALADRKALTLGPTGFPQKWYEERSPYWYSSLPTGTGVASWLSMMICRRMANMHANFSGDTTFQLRNRVFGLVHPDNPEYKEIGSFIQSQLAKCGVKLATNISYTINVATMGNQSASVAAQLKGAMVSTALCYCDPIFPIFVANSADSQDYHPEWWMPGWGDAQAQNMPRDQWIHAVVIGGKYPAKKDDEAYKVFKMIKPSAEPSSPYYAVAYGIMLLLYDALQQAGPNLNPVTFQKGWFGLGSISGPAGTLEWKPGHFSPIVSAPMAWWDPNATSNFNGAQGAYQPCEGAKFFPFDFARASDWGSGQLRCFGK